MDKKQERDLLLILANHSNIELIKAPDDKFVLYQRRIEYFIKKGYVKLNNDNEKLDITELGFRRIEQLNKEYRIKGVDKYIVKLSAYAIKQKSVDDIYLSSNRK